MLARVALYDDMATFYQSHAAGGAYNALYDRPAVLDLLGDVSGLSVLDAGCGPGLYAAELLDQGAQVTGCDQSGEMIRLARERLGERADLRVHDLDEPLTWLADDSVDLAVMALVLHHLSDPVATLREMRRVLRPGGALVLSTVHPVLDWRNHGGSYFTDTRVTETWQDQWAVTVRRAPLTTWCAEFFEAGFVIADLREPLPVPAMAQQFPAEHARLSTAPAFIAFRLTPRPRRG